MSASDEEFMLDDQSSPNVPALSVSDPASRSRLAEPPPNVLTLSTGNEEKPNPLSFARILSAVLHRIWIALPLGVLLSAAAVAALWYFTEDQYRSAAWLRIRDKPEYIAFPSSEHSRRFVATQVELMRSPVVLGQVVEMNEVRSLAEFKAIIGKEDPVGWIRNRLSVKPIGRSDLYEIAMLTREPETAATVVTSIVTAYMNFNASLSDDQFKRMRELLTEELRFRQRDCELKQERLRELVRESAGKTTGVVEEPGGQTIQGRLALLGSLQRRLVDAEVQGEILKANIAAFRETLNREIRIPDQDLTELVERDARMLAWKQELEVAKEGLTSLSATPSPIRRKEEARIADLEQKIAQRREELRPRIEQLARDQIDGDRKSELQRLEDELHREQGLVQYFRDRISDERSKHQEQGDLSLEIELARADMAHSQSIRDKISMRISAMETEARAPDRITVMQDAKVPGFPEGTSIAKKLVLVGAFALFFPLGLSTGYELMIRRVYSPSQLRQEIDVDFVGEVAALPVRRRLRSDRAFERQAYILEESVDSLRTALAVTDREDAHRVIVVCSAISGEGKSHLSSQLALSWCRGHAGPVLLIDADMRSPSLHDMFDIGVQPGLVEVLRGTATLQEAIVTDWGEGIHLLPAGKLQALHPDRLIASHRFARLLEVARQHYSRIIIDVPPILSAHETLLIARMADGAILCALRNYSRTKQLQEAGQRLNRAGVNLMGAVVNGTSTKSYVYKYGSYS
jgi:polysaccharide biosynthesis transport protein